MTLVHLCAGKGGIGSQRDIKTIEQMPRHSFTFASGANL